MASLRVPDQYVGGLAKFFQLSDEEAEKLFSLLEKSSGSQSPSRTLREALSSLDTIPKSDVEDVTQAVMSLYAIWTHSYKSAPIFAKEVIDAVVASPFEELKFSESVHNKIEPRLIKLFTINPVVLSLKADSERFEYDKVFSKADVSTDIRPIFSGSSEPPKVAMLTHTLKIHYLHDGSHREFYVALDELDLEALIEELEEARSKADSLGAILASANLTHFIPD